MSNCSFNTLIVNYHENSWCVLLCWPLIAMCVYLDPKQVAMIKIDSYFVQHPDTSVASQYPAQAYPPTHVVFVFSDYLHIARATSTFSDAHLPSAPTFKWAIRLNFYCFTGGDSFYLFLHGNVSPLYCSFCPHNMVGLQGLRAGWVQLTACSLPVAWRGVSCNRMWLDRLIKIQTQSRGFVVFFLSKRG